MKHGQMMVRQHFELIYFGVKKKNYQTYFSIIRSFLRLLGAVLVCLFPRGVICIFTEVALRGVA